MATVSMLSQTIKRLLSLVSAHPEPHSAAALVPKLIICQLLFRTRSFRKYSKGMAWSDIVSIAVIQALPKERTRCVQASPSASDCKLCCMLMAITVAIYPQLLSVVGITTAGVLSALTVTELMSSSCCLSIWSLLCSELPNSGCRNDAFIWEGLLEQGFMAVSRPVPNYCFFNTTYNFLSVASLFSCMQLIMRERQEAESSVTDRARRLNKARSIQN